jgi:DNA-directed RNA polymerase subunit beta
LARLDKEGIIVVGSEVSPGDILVGKITPKGETELSSEERLLRAIFGEKAKDVRDSSKRVGHSQGGRVIGVKVFDHKNNSELPKDVIKRIQIYLAQTRKIEVGDKLAGRYGNKGVVAKVLPVADMPFDADGNPVDVILNPLGVPSRSNLGQLFEVHLAAAAEILGYKVASPSFEGVPNDIIVDELKKAGLPEDGKIQLFDGRTGEPFQEKTTVGSMYMLKLHHMVVDKIHARSTGPYAMVTQQPLSGKAQRGGQRLGEMEVWALEAYGAANILQEMLTIKSDDVAGRAKAYQDIIKDEEISIDNIPETFNVLRRQLNGIGLKLDLINKTEDIETEPSTEIPAPPEETVTEEILEEIETPDETIIEEEEVSNE